MHKFKRVAPATAPKSRAEPEAPTTKHEILAGIWEAYKAAPEKAIREFKAYVENSGCSYAMTCRGEQAMFAEGFLHATKGIESYIEIRLDSEVADLARIRACIEDLLVRTMNHLVGTSSLIDDGPWSASSASQMHNIEAIQKANVYRRLIRMYNEFLLAIDN